MGTVKRLAELQEAARSGQIVLLSMDQTDIGDRMAILMVFVRVGRDDAFHRPTPLENNLRPDRPIPFGAFENSTVARYLGSNGGCAAEAMSAK